MKEMEDTKDLGREYAAAELEAEFHNKAFRKDLVAVLQKHELSAEVAVDRLTAFCREILCHFNTRSLGPYADPIEVKARAKMRLGQEKVHEGISAKLD